MMLYYYTRDFNLNIYVKISGLYKKRVVRKNKLLYSTTYHLEKCIYSSYERYLLLYVQALGVHCDDIIVYIFFTV